MSTPQTTSENLPVVETTFTFFEAPDNGDPAFAYAYPHDPQPNYLSSDHRHLVRHVRGHDSEFSLDLHGFQFPRQPSGFTDFSDEERIKAEYYPEVETLLESLTGAHRVFIFDHQVRLHVYGQAEGSTHNGRRGPVTKVHVDQSPKGAMNRLKMYLGDESDQLLKERVQIINVWRSIGGPVEESPLAVSDFRSINFDKDLVPVKVIYPEPGKVGEIFGVRQSPDIKFYYKSKMDTNEVILIKCFDNKVDGRARLSGHASFVDPTSPDDGRPRESIEVRALVFSHE